MTTISLSLVSLAVLAACATGDRRAKPPAFAPLPAEAAHTVPAAPPQAAAAPDDRQLPPAHGDDALLAVLASPEFRRRFAESYLAESDVEPRVTIAERALLQEVLELIGRDELGTAASLLEERRGPAASAVVDFTLANLHAQRDQHEQAAVAYAVATDKYPKFRRAWKNLGLSHFRLGHHADATTALARAIELGGGDAITYGLLGFSHFHCERFVAAESAYRMATLLDPRTLDWQLGLARALLRMQRHADSAALCAALIAQHPERADLWLLQANARLGLGQPLAAAESLEMVDRLGKSTPDSLNSLGDVYANAEINDQAVACYRRALELDPEAKPDRALRAARLLASRGASTETRQLLDAVERLRGEHLDDRLKKELLHLRARTALASAAGDDHRRALEEIVRLDPMDGEALLLLGQHLGGAGEFTPAIAWFERAAGIEAFEADAKVRHAQLLVKMGKYTAAIPLLRRAQTIRPRANVQEYLERIERFAQGRP